METIKMNQLKKGEYGVVVKQPPRYWTNTEIGSVVKLITKGKREDWHYKECNSTMCFTNRCDVLVRKLSFFEKWKFKLTGKVNRV